MQPPQGEQDPVPHQPEIRLAADATVPLEAVIGKIPRQRPLRNQTSPQHLNDFNVELDGYNNVRMVINDLSNYKEAMTSGLF